MRFGASSFLNPNLQQRDAPPQLTARRRWESNPLQTALQAVAGPSGSSVSYFQCPRQESNLVFDLRRVACESGTPRGHLLSASPTNRTSSCSFEDCRAVPAHSQGDSLRVISRLGIEPGPGPSEGPMRSATPSGQNSPSRADDWIRTSIDRFTRPAPFYVEPRRQARARGVEPRPPALETDCSPRSTPV